MLQIIIKQIANGQKQLCKSDFELILAKWLSVYLLCLCCVLMILGCYLPFSSVEAEEIPFYGKRWMTNSLIDTMPLAVLSIPGTHDSAAYTSWIAIKAPWVVTQDDTITNQLNKGIRYLDLRVGKDGNMYHGSTRVGSEAGLAGHLQELKAFLEQNPGEFILIRIKGEGFTYNTADDVRNFRLVLEKAINDSGIASYLYKGNAPTVEQMRGKVLILDNTDVLGDYTSYIYGSSLNIQDNYENVNRQEKLAAITQKMKEANNLNKKLTISHVSYTAGWATPRKLAGEMNPDVEQWIATNKQQYPITGVIPMDFPPTSLIEQIASNNKILAPIYQILYELEYYRDIINAYGPDVDEDGVITEKEAQTYNGYVDKLKELEQELTTQKNILSIPAVNTRLDKTIASFPPIPEKVSPNTDENISLTVEEKNLLAQVSGVESGTKQAVQDYQKAMETAIIDTNQIQQLQKQIQRMQKAVSVVTQNIQNSAVTRDFLKDIWKKRLMQSAEELDKCLFKEMQVRLHLPTSSQVYDGRLPVWQENPLTCYYTDDQGQEFSQKDPQYTPKDLRLLSSAGEDSTTGDVGTYTVKLTAEAINKYAKLAAKQGMYLNSDHLPETAYQITSRKIKLKLLPQSLLKNQAPSSVTTSYEWIEKDSFLQDDLASGKVQLLVQLAASYQGQQLMVNHTYPDALEINIEGVGAKNYEWDASAVRTASLTILPESETVNTGIHLENRSYIALLIICLVVGGTVMGYRYNKYR